VDFKSDERAQTEDISTKQLHVYAVGYQQLTGKNADLIEIHNLDKGGAKREVIDQNLISSTLKTISDAGKKLRENDLPRLNVWSTMCASCDMVGICRDRTVNTAP
jgi:DNA helicase-2/ATP-dependent DNA helicase PcrA